ncbi:eukaryotic translation initiation factor 4G-like [Silene latifolia]|uniref:eukaryotic translation initiation factor 4G-like n=1 Tax=Silene latifolia TaxID=37657 RepID=UPI003D77DCD1
MSLNQSRSDKNDTQFRKPTFSGARSGHSNRSNHRPFNGGRGSRAPAAPSTSTANPIPPSNRSYAKVSNTPQGAQPAQSLQNGAPLPSPLPGVSNIPVPPVVAKLADVPPQKTERPLPKAPSNQPSSTNTVSTLPSTPSKGDGVKGFSLQFGSISAGYMQVPARTSSAPPKLDEQQRDQAKRDASRAIPSVPLPRGHKPDFATKEAALVEKPVSQETNTKPHVKRDVSVTSASPPTPAQKPQPPALPMAGLSMPSPYHQQAPSMHYGGSNQRIQSHGVPSSSLQMPMPMPMPLPMGTPSQGPHQLYVHSLVHPGQNLGYTTQPPTQLPHQPGNVGINMSTQFNQQPTQFNQQPAGNFGSTRTIVKITHPDTHEELRLGNDGPSPSMSHHTAATQNQPLPPYTANHPMNYYSNTYSSGPPIFPAPSSLPLVGTQSSATTQGSRFTYPVSQAQSFVFQPSNTFPGKSGVSKLGVDLSFADHSRGIQNLIPLTQPSSKPVTIKAAGEKAASSTKGLKVTMPSKSDVASSNQFAPAPTSVTVEALIPATLPASLNTNPRDLAPIPSLDSVSKFKDVMPISTGDIQKQLSENVDGESNTQVLKHLDDSSKITTAESSEAKITCSSSEPKDGLSDPARLSPIVTDTTPNELAVKVSANLSHPSESGESQNVMNEAFKQDGPPLCEDIASKSSISNGAEAELPEVLSLDDSKGPEYLAGAGQDNSVKLTGKTEFVGDAIEATQTNADSDTPITEGEIMQSKLSDVHDISVSETSSGLLDGPSPKDFDLSKSSVTDHEVIPVSANILDANAGLETETVDISRPSSSSSSISGSSKSSLESTKPKNRGKKKLKELLQKADALGTTADLYNAYKGPEDKKESIDASEHEHADEGNMKEVHTDDANTEESTPKNKYEQSKPELEDWEDAADISTPKLESSGEGVHDEEVVTTKKYSRDFLLKFSELCPNLPEGFEIMSDVADALMRVSTPRSDREYPTAGRVVDRAGVGTRDRRANVTMNADRWNKQPGPFSPDPRADFVHGNDMSGFQGGRGPGPNYGVLRNPRPQGPVQNVGGILSGPMHSLGFQGVQRNNPDTDRWLRGTNFNKGLMPSPHTTVPVIHKAERKYEIGKVTDEEQAKQRKLKGILNKLTPQNFDRLFEQVKEVNIDNVTTLTGVISQIFDKALTEPTFCEMYANFCQHLASGLPDLSVDDEKITFRRLLLNKCQEEFERGEREEQEANNADGEGGSEQSEAVREEMRVKVRRRMLGNIRLIGELYKKRMLTERIMHECIKKLLGQYQKPDEENIEALCKLMSTIGEMIDHPKAKEHMDAYFDIMGQLSNDMKLSSRVRFMLRDAIDLRKNKWQQRRKIEGPKKIEEVHRDAAQERQGQVNRLSRNVSMNAGARRGQPLEFGPRGSMLSSPIGTGMGYRGMSPQIRGFGGQDMRMDGRNIYESSTVSVPLPQRSSSDEPIMLGPQGCLARDMAHRQPSVSSSSLYGNSPSFGDSRRMGGGLNGYGAAQEPGIYSTREGHFPRNASDRFGASVAFDQSSSQELNSSSANRDSRYLDRNLDRSRPTTSSVPRAGISVPQNHSSNNVLPEERLRNMSIAAIKEFYSVKDEKEVALCIKDLNAPSFYPNVVSTWVSDSFERKDIERDSLAKLLVSLTKPQDGTFSPSQLIQGFESVLTNLEDTVTDAPKAPEFLGRIFAKVVLENVLLLKDVGHLIQHGGEEPGRLVEVGLAAQVVASLLEMIKSEKGESTLNEIRVSSKLQLHHFLPPPPIRCPKLEMFM